MESPDNRYRSRRHFGSGSSPRFHPTAFSPALHFIVVLAGLAGLAQVGAAEPLRGEALGRAISAGMFSAAELDSMIADQERVLELMRDFRIDEIEFEDASIGAASEKLEEILKEKTHGETDIPIILQSRAPGSALSYQRASELETGEISLTIKHASLSDILENISSNSWLVFYAGIGEILATDGHDDSRNQLLRKFNVGPDFLERAHAIVKAAGKPVSPEPSLAEVFIFSEIPAVADRFLSEETGELFAYARESQLDRIEQLIASVDHPQADPERFSRKAQRIRIPLVKFEAAALEEVVEFLSAEAWKNDDAELQDHRRGMKIAIRHGVFDPYGREIPVVGRAKPITLALKDVTLEQAMKATAKQAGYRLEMHPLGAMIGARAAMGPWPGEIERRELEDKLNRILIVDLKLEKASLDKALAALEAKSAERDPTGEGIRIRLHPNDSPHDFGTVTFDSSNVTLGDALRKVVDQAGARLEFYGGEICVGRDYHRLEDPFSDL